MPQGVSAVSMVTKSKGSLTALDKQHLSYMVSYGWLDVILQNNVSISDGLSQARREAETLGATQSRLCNLLSPFWCGYNFFSVFCVILLGNFISSVWRRVLLLETQCFQYFPFSREAGSDNPIFHNAIPFRKQQWIRHPAKGIVSSLLQNWQSAQKPEGQRRRGAEGQRVVPFPGKQVILRKSLPASFVGNQSNLLFVHSGTLKVYRMSEFSIRCNKKNLKTVILVQISFCLFMLVQFIGWKIRKRPSHHLKSPKICLTRGYLQNDRQYVLNFLPYQKAEAGP